MWAQVAEMNYVDILNEAWAEHLKPRAKDAPTVISLFAGCGGSSLGYSIAGYRELLAVEWDDNAVETFKLNFEGVPVYHGDIAKLSADECMRLAGVGVGELDVLDGSPPCQGFSTAGKRIMDDPRNQLFREYVRLLRGLKPKVFVMENVSGMVKGKMKLIFADILRELKASGYKVSARLMNAMYFNVPQSRQRMIFIGVREDLQIEASHPKAESELISAINAIDAAVIDDIGKPKGLLACKMKDVLPGSNLGKTTKGGSLFSFIRCPIDKPAMTLQKSISFGGVSMWHPVENRNMSRGELKRIASYPDTYVFTGDYKDAVNRIGNSVPPLFMRAIAAHIRAEILAKAQ